jgi:pyroglutamyl-peptidase
MFPDFSCLCNQPYLISMRSILLTSFTTWLAHQKSNSSDDLLQAISERSHYHYLRSIPVDFDLAPKVVIAEIQAINPEVIVCCGMAESRQKLSIESNGKFQGEVLRSPLNLDKLLERAITTEISHDAGDYVCNYLYYSVLKYLARSHQACVFVHVPVLTPENQRAIVADFLQILDRIQVGC